MALAEPVCVGIDLMWRMHNLVQQQPWASKGWTCQLAFMNGLPVQRCPLLLRMFPKPGGHNHIQEYNNRKATMPSNELSIHTWMDADLRELADLVKQTQSVARHKDATMEFALVFPDKRGNNVMRVVRIPLWTTALGTPGQPHFYFCKSKRQNMCGLHRWARCIRHNKVQTTQKH